MKLLVLGINYAPEPVGIGPYTAELAEMLAGRGHEVRAIAGRPYYPDWKPFAGSSPGWTKRTENGVAVLRCPHFIPRRPSLLKRIVHYASFALTALFPALANAARRPDIVFAIVPSLVSLPIAWLAARICGAKLWIHVQDFEIEAAGATGLLNKDGLAIRLLRKIERFWLRRGDMVSSISPQMCARLDGLGIDPERVFEFRNWSNHLAAFQHAAPEHYRAEWKTGERKVALYSGNIAGKQGLGLVIDAARLLAERDDIIFVICGNGPARDALERQAAGLQNVQFHDLQPSEQVGDLLALAYLHVLPQLASAADLVLPSKLANMLASGRPVVATAAAGTGLADEVAGCGIAVPPDDAQALAKAIQELVDDPARARTLGAEAARLGFERWSPDRILAGVERELLRQATGEAAR